MKINIYGSTGIIGTKSLNIISSYFPRIKINLLCANKNYKLLIHQSKIFMPKYIYLADNTNIDKLKKNISNKTKILTLNELKHFLNTTKSDYSILAISGYNSLNLLEEIIQNTNNLGIVSKEAIVSAGHLFKKKKYFKKTNIFPLDSEHYSLFEFINKNNFDKNKINSIILTASGGSFYKKNFNNLKNITFKEAIKHPKWKMGYKNSIDSATLVNKCLEVVEAHYLFDIPYSKIKILIHPEAIVHSIVENKNYVTNMNVFKNDMTIPIKNFLLSSNSRFKKYDNSLYLSSYSQLNFLDVKNINFPIYKYFKNLNKNDPSNIIKFNVGNEIAVNLFKNGSIKYTDICKIIEKVGSLNLNSSLNTIKDIIEYHENLETYIKSIFKNYL